MLNATDWTVVAAICTIVGLFLSGLGWLIKNENRILRYRLDAVDKQIAKLDAAMEQLIDYKGRIALIDERLMMTGHRLDGVTDRLDSLVAGPDPKFYDHRHEALLARIRVLEEREQARPPEQR